MPREGEIGLKASDIPVGSITKVVLDSCTVALVRRADGFFALDDRCPHAGGPLSEGWLEEDGTLRCPWHERHFDPATGACVDQPKTTRNARTLAVMVEGGDVKISAPDASGP